MAQFNAAGLDLSQFSLFQRDATPLRAIDEVSKQIESDLVVVGASRFPTLKRTLVGSVSSEVVRNLQCDVLVVPPGALRISPKPSQRGYHPEGNVFGTASN